MRDIQLPGRSVSHGWRGGAATSQPLASLVAIDILRSGGNAVDAAIAACAVLCVVEPMGTGIGGDCFALCWIEKSQKLVAINGSGLSPAGLTSAWLKEKGETISETNVHAITIPGAVDAWYRLNADFGRLTMAQVLEPAIDLAQNGFAVTPVIAGEWSGSVKKLSADANAKALYLPGGKSPAAGSIFKNPGLATALSRIAVQGREGFYAGETAREMVSYLKSLGGAHTLDDFATQQSIYVEPLRCRYRDADVVQMPPNAQGLTTLLMLNILSQFDLSGHSPVSALRYHLTTEAARLAFKFRDRLVGDPAHAGSEIAEALSETTARRAASMIDPEKTMNYPTNIGSFERDTVCLSTVDSERNVCSLVNSLYFQFGTGLSTPDSAILFHNRGLGFQSHDGHPGQLGPRKRPSHTILPGMVLKRGRPWLALGVKGAAFQPIGQASIITSIIDNGYDIQEAVDAPRCGYNNDDVVEVERGVASDVRQALVELGHKVVDAKAPLGGAQVLQIDDERQTIAGASDCRKDGMAICF